MTGHIERFSTDEFAPQERTDAWRAMSTSLWECEPDENSSTLILEGTVVSQFIGSMRIVRADYNAQLCTRHQRIIAQSQLDHYILHCYLKGSHIGHYSGREIHGEPGDIRIIDMTRPVKSIVESGHSISITLPRLLMAKAAGGRSLHGQILKANDSRTKLLRSMIIEMSAPAFTVTAEQALALEDTMVLLTRASLLGDSDVSLNGSAQGAVLKERVSQFIDARVTDPELGPEMLMHEFRVSRAHLYRIFEDEGGIAALIRGKRLDAAYRSLIRPTMRYQPITQIAYENGFSNSNQFLRAFKARFELTPSDVRSLKSKLR